jgi:hypothetical protein
MPSLTWSQSVAGGAVFNPLDGWQYEYIPTGANLQLLHRATAVGMVCTFTSGSDTLQEEAPVPAGGTAGVIPSQFDVPPIVDAVAAGDRLKLRYRNTTGGAVTVDGQIQF